MLQMPTKPLNVWLVDDDASIRWVLERALRQGGMAPTAFDHADSALAALRRDRPDVLITDIRMPNIGGREFFETLRSERPELADRVVFSTGDTVRGDTLTFLESLGRPYLHKPFSLAELRGALGTLQTGEEGRGKREE